MSLSREFKSTVMELCKDPEYRRHLLVEVLNAYLAGDVVTGNIRLRDYLNGTQAFQAVAEEMHMQESSIRRMLSEKGNATLRNFFTLFRICQQREGIHCVEELVVSA